jgi:hypothetical protein
MVVVLLLRRPKIHGVHRRPLVPTLPVDVLSVWAARAKSSTTASCFAEFSIEEMKVCVCVCVFVVMDEMGSHSELCIYSCAQASYS